MVIISRNIVYVDGIPTSLIKFQPELPASEVILVIPGNPGIPSFYEQFMFHIFQMCKKQDLRFAVWSMGHAGFHRLPDQDAENCEVENGNRFYSLKEQVDHKIKFIRDHFGDHSHLTSPILVGHSFGCKVIMDIMTKVKFQQVYMLFPTIEKMYESPNGPKHWFMANSIVRNVIAVTASIIRFALPESMLKSYLSKYDKAHSTLEDSIGCKISKHSDTILYCLLQYPVLNNVLFLVKHELLEIVHLNKKVLTDHSSRKRYLFSATDNWNVSSTSRDVSDLVHQGEEIDRVVISKHIPHDFVVDHSSDVAQIVCDWISKDHDKPLMHV